MRERINQTNLGNSLVCSTKFFGYYRCPLTAQLLGIYAKHQSDLYWRANPQGKASC